jgi:hypothetical protein
MSVIWIVLATVFVFGTLAVLAYALFAPFSGHHSESFRDRYGHRLGESPHLETRDEFEHHLPA